MGVGTRIRDRMIVTIMVIPIPMMMMMMKMTIITVVFSHFTLILRDINFKRKTKKVIRL